ncbi:MAG: T9SS type A sorting domain-containing protein [Candidatus Kapabacteria bacterium]|nr:T9SS type A sorting domain-containing protein [Candidatus Kapabacteria bacterium]
MKIISLIAVALIVSAISLHSNGTKFKNGFSAKNHLLASDSVSLLLSKTLRKSKDSIKWDIISKDTFVYNKKGNLYIKNFTDTFYYDFTNRVIEQHSLINQGTSEKTLKIVKYLYLNDTIKELSTFSFSLTDKTYKYEKTVYNYGNDKKITEILNYCCDSINPLLDFKIVYSYPSSNEVNIMTKLFKNGTWADDSNGFIKKIYSSTGQLLFEQSNSNTSVYSYDQKCDLISDYRSGSKNPVYFAHYDYYSDCLLEREISSLPSADIYDTTYYSYKNKLLDQTIFCHFYIDDVYKIDTTFDNYYYQNDLLVKERLSYFDKTSSWVPSYTGYKYGIVDYIYQKISDVQDIHNKELYQITISPNPSSNYIEINKTSEVLKTSEVSKICIYNTFGELVLSKTSEVLETSDVSRIDISSLPSGIYFCTLQAGTGKLTSKFVVIK